MENFHRHVSTHTTSTSLVVPIRAYKRLNIFAILSIGSFFVGPENQSSNIYEYLTKRHIKSNQHMDNPNAFSNYVRQHSTMDSASQKLIGGSQKRNNKIWIRPHGSLLGRKYSAQLHIKWMHAHAS